MREQKKDLGAGLNTGNEAFKYSEILSMDFCGFRLKVLAQKIKSECLRFRKAETHLSN